MCVCLTHRGATPRDYRILPRKIILVRHGESMGNIDHNHYTYVPDPQVPLVWVAVYIYRKGFLLFGVVL